MARARANGPKTDGEIAAEVNKIVRSIKQMLTLDRKYTAPVVAKRKVELDTRILDLIAQIETSQHTNAARIASTIRLDYRDGRVKYLPEGVRRLFELPANWFAHDGELMADTEDNRLKVRRLARQTKAQTHRVLRRAAQQFLAPA